VEKPAILPAGFVVFSDGASRGNPGPSAIGVLVLGTDGRELEAVGEFIGDASNNEAEYRALLRGLELAAKHTNGALDACSDSEVVVRQLTGAYATRNPRLSRLQAQVRVAEASFAEVRYAWVPREHPGAVRADALANAPLDRLGLAKFGWKGTKGR